VLDWVWPPALLALAIWMLVRAHRQLRSRSRRILLYPVIGCLAVAAIGGAYQTASAAADANAYPMPGQSIDVGGHRLHLNCTGSGSPTVLLQPGAGEMSSNMGWIAPAVARNTRVCVYDRAGRGWSEPADTPQDGTQIAIDLHTLLQRGHIPGPYVLAGHSFGGRYVLAFAAQYPDDVAGMVLVDATAPASTSSAVSPRWPRHRLDSAWPASTATPPSPACPRGPATKYGPASPPQTISAARSTSSSKATPQPKRQQL
jgi:pimeloyl-ACP methyl ester carboxylesterase